jgi:MFS transporter, ACS family, D-galactonate transporter
MGRRRWGIGTLIGAGVLVNYLDRIGLSVAAPQLSETFHLGPRQLGVLFSAFFWSYALCQLPAGMVIDRLGTVRVGRWGSCLWGLASLACAAAGGLVTLMAARVFLGIAEAPSFAVSSKITGYWFPRAERALATALFDSAAKFSNVIGVPFVALLVVQWGWRWGFTILGLINLLYFAVFAAVYRDPCGDSKLSAAERALIVDGGAVPEGQAQVGAVALFGYLARQSKVWGLTLGFAAYGYVFYFFLTWLPGYFAISMHMSLLDSAGHAAIPWMVATAADLLVGGWLIDRLVARGHDDSRVRKTVLICGMTLGLAVIGASQTHDPRVATFWISVSLGGLASAAPVFWSLPSLLAPKGGGGTLGGMMNFANNLMGVVAPVVTGMVVESTGSFTAAFVAGGAILALGIACVASLVGRVEPIADAAPGDLSNP